MQDIGTDSILRVNKVRLSVRNYMKSPLETFLIQVFNVSIHYHCGQGFVSGRREEQNMSRVFRSEIPARRFRVGSMESPTNNKYNPKPSREEVQEWGISFEKLLTSKIGVKIFHDFLKSQYSEENLLFWLAVEKLKKETDQAAVKELAQAIYRDYLSAESPKEVSIDHKTRQLIEDVLEEPDQNVYDSAQRHVYYVMYQDCYPRFIVSNVFKALLMAND
ncbi:regulator of G-protein signaling rgs-2-like isoform X2 [Oculina patagonica]